MALGNPIAHLQAQFREFEGGFRSWLAAQPLAHGISREHLQLQYEVSQGEVRRVRSWLEAQPLAVEAAVVTITTTLQCAAIGGLMCKFNAYNVIQALPLGTAFSRQVQSLEELDRTLTIFSTSSNKFNGPNLAVFAGRSPAVHALKLVTFTGSYASLAYIMKRESGVGGIQNSMVAALSSGAICSIFSGMESVGENIFAAVSAGVTFTYLMHELRPLEDAKYSKVKQMLTSLGLQEYGPDFRSWGLTDEILPLITESTLHALKIPPRYAVRIVAHIQRDSEYVKKSSSLDVSCVKKS